MPQLEAGDLKTVAGAAERTAKVFAPYIADGYDVVALTASCGLMMKFEWPLMLPGNHEVGRLSAATKDICEYVMELSKAHGLTPGLKAVEGGATVHHACHARAQNMGAKSAEMLRLIPDMKVDVVERCSGHGGTFGVMKSTHHVANKVGRPAAKQAAGKGNATLCSDCPLAGKHLAQLIGDDTAPDAPPRPAEAHPIHVFARAYGVM
jgi:glycerol-3-phosphate dehydrogenase subunit C